MAPTGHLNRLKGIVSAQRPHGLAINTCAPGMIKALRNDQEGRLGGFEVHIDALVLKAGGNLASVGFIGNSDEKLFFNWQANHSPSVKIGGEDRAQNVRRIKIERALSGRHERREIGPS